MIKGIIRTQDDLFIFRNNDVYTVVRRDLIYRIEKLPQTKEYRFTMIGGQKSINTLSENYE